MKTINIRAKVVTVLMAIAFSAVSMSIQAGSMIVTGHDTDDHNADQYFDWAMNYLADGDGTGYAADTTLESVMSIGYLGNTNASSAYYGGYNSNVAFYDLDNANWTDVFSDNVDTIVIGSGWDFVSSLGSAAINSEASLFESWFNAGGNLFVNTEQGLGASFYNFLPAFGTTTNATLPGCYSGAPGCMRPTTEGAALGMSDLLVNEAFITHTRFINIDSAFTTVEEYHNFGGVGAGDAITIAFSGSISCDPSDPQASCYISSVPEPAPVLLMAMGLLGLGYTRRQNKGT